MIVERLAALADADLARLVRALGQPCVTIGPPRLVAWHRAFARCVVAEQTARAGRDDGRAVAELALRASARALLPPERLAMITALAGQVRRMPAGPLREVASAQSRILTESSGRDDAHIAARTLEIAS